MAHHLSSSHPRDRGWIIVHPNFPLGFRHFLDPHQQNERTICLTVDWFRLPIPLTLQQRALHQWDSSQTDSTGHVLWRASQKLAEYLIEMSRTISKSLTIVELGCGACAVPSITASLCGHKVIATDLAEIMAPARVNIEYNLNSFRELGVMGAPWTTQCTCNNRKILIQNECKNCGSVKFQPITLSALPWGQPVDHSCQWKDNGD